MRHLKFLTALLGVAVAAAAFAAAFRATLAWWYHAVFHANDVVDAMAKLPRWLRVLVPAAGGCAAGLIARLRAGSRQGVSNVMEAVALGNVRLSFRTTLSRVLSSWTAMAGGLSIGREGPLIEFGGTVGASIARLTSAPLLDTRVLVASGTAAGFAAAYNTPFAAVLFVFETILGIAAPAALVPTIGAVVLSTALIRWIVGSGPIYGQRLFALQSQTELLAFAALGLLAAIAALGFKRLLAWFEHLAARYPIPQPFRATIGGLLVGMIALGLPAVAGNGYEPLNLILDQRIALTAVAILLVAKIVATSGSVSSGVPGGIFTPTLLVGASLGTLWAHAISLAFPGTPVSAGSYALVGMAAATAASIHAPLTAAVLVFELSGDYPIVLPLLLATAIAAAMSRRLGSQSVYDAELSRKGVGWELTLEGRQLK
ncbi:MAG TPA: chloride channel protein [Vicinamibacterales bacterium]|nr:chloride channel protein [Vicinamibacterales bacterium]